MSAARPKAAARADWCAPAAMIAPTMDIPEIALAPDISGVCSVGGTLLMTSNPMNAASRNTVSARMNTAT